MGKKKKDEITVSADPTLHQLIQDINAEEERVKAAVSDERAAMALLGSMKSLNLWNQTLVNIISRLFPQKQVQKELKRLAYLFSQKGVETYVPQEAADSKRVVVTMTPLKEAWSTFNLIPKRWRYVFLKFSKSAWVFLQLSPHEGIKNIHEGKEEHFLKIVREFEGELLRVPVDYVAFMINLAKKKTEDPKLFKMVEELELLINIKEPAEIDKLFDFTPLLDVSIFELSREQHASDTVSEIKSLLEDQDILGDYLRSYKEAVNPRIILDKSLIQSRKMSVIDALKNEILVQKDKFIFALKEDIFLLSLARKDIPFAKRLLLKIFLEEHIAWLEKVLELALEDESYRSEAYASRIIIP